MSDLDLDSLDWLLGRLDGVESARVAAANAADPVLGQRTADTAQFLARLRELQPPPATPGFFVRLRYSVRRRTELRVVRAPVRVQSVLRDVVRVAAVAAVVLGAALLGEAACRRLVVRPPVDVDALPLPDPLVAIDGSPRPDPTEPFVDVEPPPTRVQVVSPFFAQVEEVTADDGAEAVLSWLGARNELDALRNEFRQRFSSDERRTVLAATGANPAREERIQALAAAVASKMEAELAEPSDPAARALGLRALLAAGSSRVVGPHRALVRQATESVLAELAGEPRVDLTVSLLAALTDVAVLSGGEEGEVVRRHAERIARATTDLGRGRRPALLHWQTRLAALGDAGYVLRLAPAFGAPAQVCLRARRLVLAHLEERLAGGSESPEVIAAMLYGFGDLVDRAALDARLLPDYIALLHYAWGQYPVRTGWASFQDDLRYLSTLPVPASLADAAALSMTLATNFAAPGALDLLARR